MRCTEHKGAKDRKDTRNQEITKYRKGTRNQEITKYRKGTKYRKSTKHRVQEEYRNRNQLQNLRRNVCRHRHCRSI